MNAQIATIITFAGFVALPLAVIASKGEVVLLGIAALTVLFAWVQGRAWKTLLRARFLLLLLAVPALGAATAAWAVVPRDALELAGSLTLLFLASAIVVSGAKLDDAARQNFAATAGAGYGFGCILLFVEFYVGMPITHMMHYQVTNAIKPELSMLNPALSVLVIIVWPFAAAGQRFLSFVALTAASIIALGGDMVTARLAMGAAGVAFLLVMWFGRATVLALGTAAVLFVAAAPFLGQLRPTAEMQVTVDEMRGSVAHRLCIWEFASARILEKPLLGWGLDSSRSIPGGEVECVEDGPSLSLHPHNAALQVWLELGIVGAFLLASLLALAFRFVGRMPAGTPQAGATASLVAALMTAFLSYGVWQNWWIAVLALGAMTVRAALPGPAPARAPTPAKKPAAAAAGAQPLAQIPTAKVPAALAKK